MRLLRWYTRLADRSPLATRIATGSILGVAGDASAQAIEQSRRPEGTPAKFDLTRTLAFGGIGIWWTGIFFHKWLQFLARTFPGEGLKMALTKSMMNQIIGNSCIYIPAVYFWNGKLCYGTSNEEIIDKLCKEYRVTATTMMSIWFPSNMFMFFLVPLNLQVLYTACVGLVWNITLSLMYNSAQSTSVALDLTAARHTLPGNGASIGSAIASGLNGVAVTTE